MNITLRPWREADAAPCAALANDEGVAANLRDVFPHPYAEQDARDFIALCCAAVVSGRILFKRKDIL